ncbi:MAG: cupredoxin domain-containing protein [Acidimicrobiales bacterium]
MAGSGRTRRGATAAASVGAIVLAVLVALVLGGCGSGGSKRLTAVGASSSTTAPGSDTSSTLSPGPVGPGASLPPLTTALPDTSSTTPGGSGRSSSTNRAAGSPATYSLPSHSTTTGGSRTSTTLAGAKPTSTTKAAAANAAISIRNFAFSPNPLRVAPGTRVVTTNREDASTGRATHTWTSDTGQWNSGDIVPGATYAFVFPTPGTFPYHCNIHASMHGTVIVG